VFRNSRLVHPSCRVHWPVPVMSQLSRSDQSSTPYPAQLEFEHVLILREMFFAAELRSPAVRLRGKLGQFRVDAFAFAASPDCSAQRAAPASVRKRWAALRRVFVARRTPAPAAFISMSMSPGAPGRERRSRATRMLVAGALQVGASRISLSASALLPCAYAAQAEATLIWMSSCCGQ